jgi:hypothetical protein
VETRSEVPASSSRDDWDAGVEEVRMGDAR